MVRVGGWLAFSLLAAGISGWAQDGSPEVEKLDASRAVVAEFQAALQGELSAAMREGGPVAAVAVCRDRAPQIASELARKHGIVVGRTSLRTRNPLNAPADWQKDVLATFEETGEREYFDGDSRYMKAIVLQPLCTVCHGKNLSDDVTRILGDAYPHDRATGYEAGEVRGAFVVVWPDQ